MLQARIKRGGHKANLTKICKDVYDCIKGFKPGQEPVLLALKGSLERKSSIIMILDDKVMEEIDDEEDIVDKIENCEKVQMKIQETILVIDYFLTKLKVSVEKKPEVKPVKESSNSSKSIFGKDGPKNTSWN